MHKACSGRVSESARHRPVGAGAGTADGERRNLNAGRTKECYEKLQIIKHLTAGSNQMSRRTRGEQWQEWFTIAQTRAQRRAGE